MAKREYTFTGKAAWVGKRPNNYGKFTLNLYPATAADRKAIKDTGIKNKTQEDDGSKSGVEGLFYTLRSNVPYAIVDAEGKELEAMVGNGSTVEVVLEVETFMSQSHGAQARSEVKKVIVHNLIPYIPKEKTEAETALPT